MNACLRLLSLPLVGLFALAPAVQAQNTRPAGALPTGFERVELAVDGIARMALVYAPPSAKTTPTPVVFGFHGHGGTAAAGAREFDMHREWPEAIAVYPQALNTPGRFIDFEGKQSGWQLRQGHEGDRDLKFFDVLLARLKQDYQVDERRIYAVGNSSGGYFIYLLWAQRGDTLTAVAPVASEAADNLPALKPKPVIFVGGENDQRVKYEWIRTTMDAVRKLNGCAGAGTPWGEHCVLFPSASGTPVVEFIHPGGHEYPKGANAAIVRFFEEHPKNDTSFQTGRLFKSLIRSDNCTRAT
jgi:polyhydroxybutyrate depolymerase